MRSSCVPCSSTTEPATLPPPAMPPAASLDPSTMILSAPRTVVRRCAMTSVVRRLPATSSSSARCTRRSFSVSRAEVASSRIKIGGLRNAARAMATRCFCPPLSVIPFSPISVASPCGNSWISVPMQAESSALA
mmetsp:Transcript_19450/g.48635  ORF Transcript_19450/g.48635 Transcript_19450/m.48635 type:complete len:134 (-) Transcript_19450:1983-2384(-)